MYQKLLSNPVFETYLLNFSFFHSRSLLKEKMFRAGREKHKTLLGNTSDITKHIKIPFQRGWVKCDGLEDRNEIRKF